MSATHCFSSHFGRRSGVDVLHDAADRGGDLGELVLIEREFGVALDAFGDGANDRWRRLDANEGGGVRGGQADLGALAGL